ncbi:conserved Plasmodium protein, unknown function [Plasmodium vinckei]|uniref:Uncharacterized protein n=1 Tax=Plasmodium vinckei TaxID=5860 RepID=A0A6V7T7R7_PLAVN|nr:conserved Plasmodium protein, unknown function [Plasmodium vinckei]
MKILYLIILCYITSFRHFQFCLNNNVVENNETSQILRKRHRKNNKNDLTNVIDFSFISTSKEGNKSEHPEDIDNHKKENHNNKKDNNNNTNTNNNHHENNHNENNQPKSNSNNSNTNHSEQNHNGNIGMPNAVGAMPPIAGANFQKNDNTPATHPINMISSENIFIPEDIKKDFMKLLASVIKLNTKDSSHPSNQFIENNKPMNPLLQNNHNPQHPSNSSFIKSIYYHFKNHLSYYVIGTIVLFILTLLIQASSVSDDNNNKKKKKIKKDRSQISNYRRTVEC